MNADEVARTMDRAWATRACQKLRATVLGALAHEEFRRMLREVHSVGPAPRSAEAAEHRTGGAWRQPGRGAFVYANEPVQRPDSHDGQVSRPAPRIDTQEVSQADRKARWQCPEALEHRAGADGRCEWCSRRVAAPMPRPDLSGYSHTDLGDSYRYYYEPDWGSDRRDS